MQKIVSPPWSPVRVPRIQAAQRRPVSLGAISRLRELEIRQRQTRQHARALATGGCAIIAILTGIVIPFVVESFLRGESALHPTSAQSLQDISSITMVLNALLLFFTFPLASLTSHDSRPTPGYAAYARSCRFQSPRLHAENTVNPKK
jgi:hypothetical protein